MPVAQDTRGIIQYFIEEHGVDNPELRIPVGSEKELPDRVKKLIKSTVRDAGWQVKDFRHKKCQKTKGITHFVFIQRIVKPTTRDN
ncbi:MAG: hypothetical protein NTX00_04035 [Candidatus Parcubacteria bacterium]|nr:hypothetical protein [Candidatus Parcubacteria bacterium]